LVRPRRRNVLPAHLTAGWIAILLIGHAIYGLLLARAPLVATAHAALTLVLGIWIALTSSMRRVAYICAYIAGCEILWRMARALIPWEFGKYAICLLVLLTFARMARLRWDWPAITYFLLMIPSTIIAFSEHPFPFARQQVSFNLSGPLTLALTSWFFALWRPTRDEIVRIFIALCAPIMSLGAIAATHTASLEDLNFTDASNFQTSAGYGPNQVSTALGLGALLAVVSIALLERGVRERLMFAAIALFLSVESALTFSRGGLFSALGAFIIAAPFLARGTRNRVALLIGAAATVATLNFVVLPQLDSFTQGALSERFHDTDPTGRDELIRTELETFEQHPIFGIGPAAMDEFGSGTVSVHTEFTRLPAQHGIFGILALFMMLVLAASDFARQPSTAAKAICVVLIAWSLLTMGHAAMRLAIVPFIYGLGAASFRIELPALRRGRDDPAAAGA
jgi:O-antigen ligase